MYSIHAGATAGFVSKSAVRSNDDLFDRLETVRFFRLFTHEGDIEYKGCSNTEQRGLKARVLP